MNKQINLCQLLWYIWRRELYVNKFLKEESLIYA